MEFFRVMNLNIHTLVQQAPDFQCLTLDSKQHKVARSFDLISGVCDITSTMTKMVKTNVFHQFGDDS